jgi:hypothetical protein
MIDHHQTEKLIRNGYGKFAFYRKTRFVFLEISLRQEKHIDRCS